jgi:hypothetical protein
VIPTLTYEIYRQTHNKLQEDEFKAALPAARARLVAITGKDIPSIWELDWLAALSELCEHMAGAGDTTQGVKQETIGGTTKVYTNSKANKGDVDAVAPWLYGTGLLYCGLA